MWCAATTFLCFVMVVSVWLFLIDCVVLLMCVVCFTAAGVCVLLVYCFAFVGVNYLVAFATLVGLLTGILTCDCLLSDCIGVA